MPTLLMRRFALLMALSALLILGASAMLSAAQEDETAPDSTLDYDCDDPVSLILVQVELSARLDSFAEQVRTGDETAYAELYAVGSAYQEIALACGYIPANADTLVINTTDLERVLPVLETLIGDPLNGQLLYNGETATDAGDTLGCSGCHAGEVAPLTEGTWTRWDEERSQLSEFSGQPFEYYMAHSILLPWDYFVPTWPEYTMPDFYAEQMSYQDLADIIAYLSGQDQLID